MRWKKKWKRRIAKTSQSTRGHSRHPHPLARCYEAPSPAPRQPARHSQFACINSSRTERTKKAIMLTLNMMIERILIATLVSSAAIGGPPLSLKRRTKGVAATAVSAFISAGLPQVSFLLFLLVFRRESREWERAEDGMRERRQIGHLLSIAREGSQKSRFSFGCRSNCTVNLSPRENSKKKKKNSRSLSLSSSSRLKKHLSAPSPAP